jgi:cysteate synthase
LAELQRMYYQLRCPGCGLVRDDDGSLLICPEVHSPALLTSTYSSRTLEINPNEQGIYRYQCWLPHTNRLENAPRSIVYRSEQLGPALNLTNLWIAFSGYWPERGAELETASFKELEVGGVLSRMRRDGFRALVVASAGNTAAAFARACSENDVPCLIVIPSSGLEKMRFATPLRKCVKLICLTGSASYSDAIALAEQISRQDGFVYEGGVKNVGRRDGMATVMYSAVESIGKLPDYYFQAIGSGAGAIAAHEAAKRLIQDSRFGLIPPRLMLAQNVPFTPIYDSWRRGRREPADVDPSTARILAEKIVARVLTNRQPPYAIRGGMYDVLRQSHGEMFAVENEEVLRASKMFENCEGVDIDPAAAVAVAALAMAAKTGQVKSEENILLHITGGGLKKRMAKGTLYPAQPDLELSLEALTNAAALETICGFFANKRSKAASA